jgi:hypothetical protein
VEAVSSLFPNGTSASADKGSPGNSTFGITGREPVFDATPKPGGEFRGNAGNVMNFVGTAGCWYGAFMASIASIEGKTIAVASDLEQVQGFCG